MRTPGFVFALSSGLAPAAGAAGCDDEIAVDRVEVEEVKIADETGTDTIELKSSEISDKLDIGNTAGSIEIGDTSWGRRKVRKSVGPVNSAYLNR